MNNWFYENKWHLLNAAICIQPANMAEIIRHLRHSQLNKITHFHINETKSHMPRHSFRKMCNQKCIIFKNNMRTCDRAAKKSEHF